ncbi:hypothetical protein [Halomonas sp. BMC6]|uniref:hypothetical protein n=1 Tax=Halomonas sp. BMC6 TaxID=3073244 RepID=UPI00336E33F1
MYIDRQGSQASPNMLTKGLNLLTKAFSYLERYVGIGRLLSWLKTQNRAKKNDQQLRFFRVALHPGLIITSQGTFSWSSGFQAPKTDSLFLPGFVIALASHRILIEATHHTYL